MLGEKIDEKKKRKEKKRKRNGKDIHINKISNNRQIISNNINF